MSKKKSTCTPVILVILDGWGIAKKSLGNAITRAKTPTFDLLYKKFPHMQIKASGTAVGLPNGQHGNSEAGHMNLGAGRVVLQDSVLISREINSGTFFKNPALMEAVHHSKEQKSNVHIMGLLTNSESAHAHPKHLYALLEFLHTQKVKHVYLHLFSDGRDSPPHAGLRYIEKLVHRLYSNQTIVTISGRYYAMDRARNWDRIEKAYNAMVLGEGRRADNPMRAFEESYNRGVSDEYIEPTIIDNPRNKIEYIRDNDSIIFFNCRSDRARELTKPFVQPGFERKGGFRRKKKLKGLKFVTFTDFGADLDSVLTAFPPATIHDTVPFVLSGKNQLYIAEREKFAHVTYFFGGGRVCTEKTVSTVIVPSKPVQTFNTSPEMSLPRLRKALFKELKKYSYDLVVINVANPDMVAHTGDLEATIKAVEFVDRFIKDLYSYIRTTDGALLITADHGNAEELITVKTDEINTAHSSAPVPFILVGNRFTKRNTKLRSTGKLCDVAPTILELLDVEQPSLMTGRSLIK